jgi:hypothetical protein
LEGLSKLNTPAEGVESSEQKLSVAMEDQEKLAFKVVPTNVLDKVESVKLNSVEKVYQLA